MYNTDIKGLSPTNNEQILYFIQEIKRNIILRRYIRATTGVGLTNYNQYRINAHIALVLKKTIYQRQMAGIPYGYLDTIQNAITQML
jgi:hypothetical protein